MIAQLLGACLSGICIFVIWNPFIIRFEREKGIIRGYTGSHLSAMMFGEYFPNPSLQLDGLNLVSSFGAMCIEALGTAILTFVVFSFSDKNNKSLAKSAGIQSLAPFFIGFTVSVLICLLAPFTQAGFNPARDFGPRLVACFAGWWGQAIPGPNNGFWVYIVGPMIGAPIGGFLYEFVFGICYRDTLLRTGHQENNNQIELKQSVGNTSCTSCKPVGAINFVSNNFSSENDTSERQCLILVGSPSTILAEENAHINE